jgi:hypothetical protein
MSNTWESGLYELHGGSELDSSTDWYSGSQVASMDLDDYDGTTDPSLFDRSALKGSDDGDDGELTQDELNITSEDSLSFLDEDY